MNKTKVDMERILLAGDSHSDADYIHRLCYQAVENKCQAVFVVGDFGYYMERKGGFLESCTMSSKQTGVPIFWLDGNHENHDLLNDVVQKYVLAGGTGPFVPIVEDHIFYAPRGARWEWSGRKFLALGGAYSVDRGSRVKFVSWWPSEEMSEGEFRRLCDNLDHVEVDVMLTHDIPDGVNMNAGDHWKFDFPETIPNRKRLQFIANMVQPKLLVHGHMHHSYTQSMQVGDDGSTCVVKGLGCNLHPLIESTIILDISSESGMILRTLTGTK